MKVKAALTALALALPVAAFAQSGASSTPSHPKDSPASSYGSSPRCDTMTGADKEQCLRDEATKTQGGQAEKDSPGSSSTGSSSTSDTTGSASGSSATPSATDTTTSAPSSSSSESSSK